MTEGSGNMTTEWRSIARQPTDDWVIKNRTHMFQSWYLCPRTNTCHDHHACFEYFWSVVEIFLKSDGWNIFSMTEFQPPYFPPPFASSVSGLSQPQSEIFQPLTTASTDPYQTFHQHSSISPQFSYDNLRRDYTLHQRQASAKYLVHVWAFHSHTPLQYSTYFLG